MQLVSLAVNDLDIFLKIRVSQLTTLMLSLQSFAFVFERADFVKLILKRECT